LPKPKKYKLKSHSGAKDRFHVTGGGKFTRRRGHLSHLHRKKRAATLRQVSRKLPVSEADVPRLRRLLPYSD
jgi:large subunit ribosomal protein L35